MRKIRLLIVDDDDINNFIIQRLTSKTPFETEVEICKDGQETLDYLRDHATSQQPDIILIDINMPVLNGWELLDELSKMTDLNVENMHIYVITSSVYKYDVVKSQNYKMVKDFISKPLNLEKMIEIFENLNLKD